LPGPFVNFYTSDFLAGTGGMSAATKGVYITLLCLMYEAEAPLKQPHGSLARRCGASNSVFRRALDDLICEGKIEENDGCLWSKKVEKHISYRREMREKKSKSAFARWEKTKENQGGGDANAMRPECYPKPKPKPYIKRDTKVSPKSADKPRGPSFSEMLQSVLSKDVADAFVEHRRRIKKPLSERACKLIIKKLEDCPDPDAAADEAIEKGWSSVFPKQGHKRKETESAPDRFDRLAAELKREGEPKLDDRTSSNAVVPLLPARHTAGH